MLQKFDSYVSRANSAHDVIETPAQRFRIDVAMLLLLQLLILAPQLVLESRVCFLQEMCTTFTFLLEYLHVCSS